jgi:hypothetical protein
MDAWGLAIDVSNFGGGRCQTCRQYPLGGPAIDASNSSGGRCRTCRQHLPGAPPLTSPTLVVAAIGPAASTPHGARHRCLNSGGGRCRTCHQHPRGGPPSTSPTPMVAAAGPAASNPQKGAIDVSNSIGGCCRTCRQQPPGGPLSASPTPVVAAARPTAGKPQGVCHRRLQLRWWPLPDLPSATPMGPANDVSNSSGGHCQTCRQHPQGGRRRRFATLGTYPQNFSGDTYLGGHHGKHYRYKQATWQKNGGKSFSENFLGPCGAKNPGIIIPLQRLSPNQQTAVRHYQLLE